MCRIAAEAAARLEDPGRKHDFTCQNVANLMWAFASLEV